MAEKQLWKYVRDGMGKSWHPQRHEDKLASGIADVSYALAETCGWIELKWSRDWPNRAHSSVPLDHFTTEQRRWLSKRRKHSKNVYLLWQIADEYFLFNNESDFDLLGHITRADLEARALAHWKRGINWETFRAVLCI